MTEKLLAVVPARKGSRRLPNKNFDKFLGKPLYLRALSQALSLPSVSKVLFSTDACVGELVIPEGVVIDPRPEHLTQHDSSSQELACYLWRKYATTHTGLLWLQPTSPLRSRKHIMEAIKLWSGEGSVASCCVGSGGHTRVLYEGMLSEQGEGNKVNLNGAIYILDPMRVLRHDWVIGAKAYIMPENKSVDIDTAADWSRACELMEDV